MNKFRILVVLCVVSLVPAIVGAGGCHKDTNSADQKMAKKTEKQMQEAYKQVGMPAIKNFQELKQAKMIAELRDREDLVCYAYLHNKYTGELKFLGKCMGFGLPYSVQMTNPKKLTYADVPGHADKEIPMPQPEPNGLFMPEGLSATWLMMIDGDGNTRPVYVEPEIVVSPCPLDDTEPSGNK